MKRTLVALAATLAATSTLCNQLASAAEPAQTNRFAATAYTGPEAAAKILLQNDLNDKEVQFWLARINQRHSDLETATELLEEAADEAQDDAIVQLRYGQLSCTLAGHPETGMLSKAGLAGDCRDALERASSLNPKLLNAWRGLFDFYRMAPGIVGGGIDKAEQVISKIAALDPAAAEISRASLAVQQEKPALMREHIAKAIALDPAKADEYRFNEALLLMRLEDFPAAYEVLKGIRTDTVDQASVQYQLGRIAVLAKQAAWYADAEQQLLAYLARTDLTEEQITKPWASFRLGQLYELMGKPEQAKQRFQWSASQQPDERLKEELKKKSIKV